MLRVPVSKRGMAHFIHDVFPIITAAAAFLSTIVTVVITLSRARIEHRNLRRIDVKDRLDLLDEVEKRLDQDSLHAWRYKNAEPPKGSIEDQLAKDLLVSHVFGRSITWLEWLAIRRFLAEQDKVGVDLLRLAWPYRDQEVVLVRFRMTWRSWLRRVAYTCVSLTSGLSVFFGYMLVLLSLNHPTIGWLLSLIPQLSGLLSSLDLQSWGRVAVLRAQLVFIGLSVFIPNEFFNYGLPASWRICKQLKAVQ